MKQHDIINGTRRLFDEDAYTVEFTAEVISCTERKDGRFEVVLDRTAFFPEGGGQPSDTGLLIGENDGSEIRVIHAEDRNGEIVHIAEMAVNCGKIIGHIDFDLRYERMRNHTGEHLFSGIAHSLFGCTNVGFHLNDEAVTVDLDTKIDRSQVAEIEREVNRIIAENVPVTAYYPEPDELSALDYRSKLELTENVRLVKIGEYDLCACCAPHVRSTAEIGMLLVTDVMNYKGGTRLTMVCGKNAYLSASLAIANTKETAAMLSAKYTESADAVKRLLAQIDKERARAAELCSEYIDLRMSAIELTDGNILLIEPKLDRNALRRLVDRAADICGGICGGFTGSDESGWSYIMISRNLDLRAMAKEINEKLCGKGGGSAEMIQGSTKITRAQIKAAWEEI